MVLAKNKKYYLERFAHTEGEGRGEYQTALFDLHRAGGDFRSVERRHPGVARRVSAGRYEDLFEDFMQYFSEEPETAKEFDESLYNLLSRRKDVEKFSQSSFNSMVGNLSEKLTKTRAARNHFAVYDLHVPETINENNRRRFSKYVRKKEQFLTDDRHTYIAYQVGEEKKVGYYDERRKRYRDYDTAKFLSKKNFMTTS